MAGLPWAFVKVAFHLQSIAYYNYDFCDGSVTNWLKAGLDIQEPELLCTPRFVVAWSIDRGRAEKCPVKDCHHHRSQWYIVKA